MDSSKRHWPSMFKSKSSINSPAHQWQLDTTPVISTNVATTAADSHPPSAISSGTEERTPEPKPRWNPKPEQIRILEGIFNSGMVNPPRDEIRRIRAQLQEFGQVGDANVFYWFQNRKSRSKNKKNNLFQNSTTKSQRRNKNLQKSSNIRKDFFSNVLPTCSMNDPYFCTTTSSLGELLPEPYLFPASQSNLVGGATAGAVTSLGKCSGSTTNVLLTDWMNVEAMNDYYKKVEDNDKIMMQQQFSYSVTTATTTATPISAQTILPPTALSAINHIQDKGIQKCTVFINDMAIEVASGPFDVREAFGEDAVLLHSSGQPVLTNQWGITLHSLQHGAFYYLVRIIATPSPPSQTHSSSHLI